MVAIDFNIIYMFFLSSSFLKLETKNQNIKQF
jgi:hypothetical protein